MEKKNVQRRERKTVQISIRTTEANSKFMRANNIAPNAVFEKALEELISKE